MMEALPDILARIVESKREEIAGSAVTRDEWEHRAYDFQGRRDFRSALAVRPPSIIAEIKKASPSKGLLIEEFDPPALARDYELGGAAALSVLTDERFFQGGMSDLVSARRAVSLPVLRKDFTLEEIQVAEAAAHGADAILLIAAILPEVRLRELREYAARFGMAALVEVHDKDELALALASGASVVGVNNRNLRTFEVSLETSLRLAEHIPGGTLKVSESGIRCGADILKLRAAGFDAFLIGEHLVKSTDRASAVKELRG
jgi:indole-3-glycerol phosphate synthase